MIGRDLEDRPSAKYLLEKIPDFFPKTFVEPEQLSSTSSTQSDVDSDHDDGNIESLMDDSLLTEILSSTRFNENCTVIKYLTSGNYGAIFKAKNYTNDEEYAIKIIRVEIES